MKNENILVMYVPYKIISFADGSTSIKFGQPRRTIEEARCAETDFPINGGTDISSVRYGYHRIVFDPSDFERASVTYTVEGTFTMTHKFEIELNSNEVGFIDNNDDMRRELIDMFDSQEEFERLCFRTDFYDSDVDIDDISEDVNEDD